MDRTTYCSFLVAILLAWTLPAEGQVPEEVGPVLAAKALRAVGASMHPPIESNERVWVRGIFDSGEMRGSMEELVEAIQAHFPRALPTEDYGTLFLCPPGEEVRMPGNGCPIRDEGRIVNFLYQDPGEGWDVKLAVTVITTGCEGECTWMEAWSVEFSKSLGDWIIRSVIWSGIT